MSTLLTELVRKQSAYAMVGIFNRVIDKVAEEIAHDLLRDAELRAELEKLVRLAIQQALKELNEPATPEDDQRRHRYKPLDQQIDEQLSRNKEAMDKAKQP
jgi:hypothetical protein